MRKITRITADAFKNFRPCKISNSEVYKAGPTTIQYYLHGHMIAQLKDNILLLKDCGYQTNTTKERLNGILDAFGLGRIYQKNWTRYYENNKGDSVRFEDWMTLDVNE